MLRCTRSLRRGGAILATVVLAAVGASDAFAARAAAASSVDVQLLGFNDFHGNLDPATAGSVTVPPVPPATTPTSVPAGGAAYLAAHLHALRASNPNTLIVTAGDNFGASPLVSALFHDEPTVQAFNLMHVDLASVGNHEFDDGLAELQRMQYGGCFPTDPCTDPTQTYLGADFRYLAANVVEAGTGTPVFPPYAIRTVAGIKIGFIGVVTKTTPTIVSPGGIVGLKFLDEAATVNRYVPALRQRGADAIVVLIHEGGAQVSGSAIDDCNGLTGPIVDIANAIDDRVDVIVSGHTHTAYNCTIDGKLVTQALSAGRVVTDIDLHFDRKTHELQSTGAVNEIVTRDVTPDFLVASLVQHYTDLAAPLQNRVIGSISGDLTHPPVGPLSPTGETNLGDVIADSQLAATTTTGSAQIAFMNPGGIRNDLLTATISGGEAPGEVTYGELFSVQPFGNSLVTLTLTGAQIDAVLEQQFDNPSPGSYRILQVSQGFTYAWDPAAPLGSHVDAASIMLNGTPIDPAASYRVTVNSFLADGGDNFTVLKEGTDRVGGGQDIDAFVAFLTAHTPLAPPALDRIALVPAP